jgi:hypothetical protein
MTPMSGVRRKDGRATMTSGWAAVAVLILLVTGACGANPEGSPGPDASVAASSAASAAPLSLVFEGSIPRGWVEGEASVPTPEDDGVVVEAHRNEAVMAADCSFGPEPGVETSAEAITDAIADRDGLEIADRGTVTVDGQSGMWLDFTVPADAEGTCNPEENVTYVPLFGHYDAADQWLFTGAAPGETHRLIVVDAPDAGNALIWMYASAPETLTDYMDAAMDVVGGLRFESP